MLIMSLWEQIYHPLMAVMRKYLSIHVLHIAFRCVRAMGEVPANETHSKYENMSCHLVLWLQADTTDQMTCYLWYALLHLPHRPGI